MNDQFNQQINPDIIMKHSKEIECSSCGCIFFKQVVTLRRVSRVVIGTPTDQVLPIPVFRCDDCGLPLNDLLDNETDNEPPSTPLKLIT